MWAGEIQFQSIQLNNSSVSISYVDVDGVKTFTCKEQPREEFRTAMAAMSFYYTDMAGDYGPGKPAQAIFAVDKVVPKRDKKSGALKGVRLSGRFHIKDSAATQRFTTRSYDTPDGQKRWVSEVTANFIALPIGMQGNESQQGGGQTQAGWGNPGVPAAGGRTVYSEGPTQRGFGQFGTPQAEKQKVEETSVFTADRQEAVGNTHPSQCEEDIPF